MDWCVGGSLCVWYLQVKIWFQNRRMKWRNSKERELLASGGSREQTLPNKNNPNPDLSDADGDKPKTMREMSPEKCAEAEELSLSLKGNSSEGEEGSEGEEEIHVT